MAVLTTLGAAGLAYSAYMGGGLKKDLLKNKKKIF